MEFVRRIGIDPKVRGDSTDDEDCPDIWELDSGDFAVIGVDMTSELARSLPSTARKAERESIVVITRATLVAAKPDIPES